MISEDDEVLVAASQEYDNFDDDEILVAASQDYEKLSHCSEDDTALTADQFLDDELTQQDVERLAPLLDSQRSHVENSVVDYMEDNSVIDICVAGNDASSDRKTVKFGC